MAKAAVEGDEIARDLLDYKSQSQKNRSNKMDTKNIFMSSNESLSFLLAGDKGSVYLINDSSKFNKLFQMESGIARILYNADKAMLISISKTQMLGQYVIKSETEVRNLMTVKLNGKNQNLDFAWIGANLLAYVSGENVIR